MIPLHNLRRFFYKAIKQPSYALKVFKKRLVASAYYLWGNGQSSQPEAITLFLTHKCNLRCKMCGQWGEGGVTRREDQSFSRTELSFEEAKGFIDAVSADKPNITLFGGEPLLFAHCTDLIRYIKGKSMHCLVITNGSLLEEMAEDIAGSGLDELNVSLDGQAALHDQIRGMPGLFDSIMRGLETVNRYKERCKKKRPLVNIQCTINKYNYDKLEQLLDVAEKSKASSLTFHNLIFMGRATAERQKKYDIKLRCDSKMWEGFMFEPGIDPRVLHDKMGEILSERRSFSLDFYPHFSPSLLSRYYTDCDYIPLEYGYRCISPWVAAYVFPGGEVRPCLNCSYSYGNIREKRFSDIWNSETAVQYRKFLKKNRMFPVCVRCTELYRY